jgi:class 3 adenylate cyclase/TolB-like protein
VADESDLEKLFAARREIDRALLEQHARFVAVMFTDIVGSTAFFERKGDIEGLALVKRHNDALLPLVPAHGGRVVKTIGDAIMAVFDTAASAAACAARMQQTLRTMNLAQPGEGEIHIRIGIHAGKALLDAGDLFGDTVNVAARVNHEAGPDEVLLSEAGFTGLGGKLPARPRGSAALKGKSAKVALFALDYGEGTPPIPVAATSTPSAQVKSEELFVLELGRTESGLRVSVLDGARDKGTVKAFAEVALRPEALDALARSFGTFMHAGPPSYRDEICDLGGRLFTEALPARAQDRLRQSEVRFARVMLDDALCHVPWELLHDGHEFLCLRFAAGRTVVARASTLPGVRMPVQDVQRALVVSNPSGDLPASGREGEAVATLLRDGAGLEVTALTGPVSRAQFLAALQGTHWLHFAGHAVQAREQAPAGLLCSDGVVGAAELMDAIGATAPAVVFANACRATGEAWVDAARGSSSIASGLLLRGVGHFLAPAWELPDEDGLAFALRFYEHALAGVCFGEAVRRARLSLLAQASTPVSFAGYVLYGDPRLRLPTARLAAQPLTRSVDQSGPHAMPAPAVLAEVLPPEPPVPLPRRSWQLAAGLAAGAIALGGGVLMLRKPAPMQAPTPIVPAPPVPAAIADPARHQGPLRLAVLPFKNLTADPKLEFLAEAWPEGLTTDLAGKPGYQLIEHAQLQQELDYAAFTNNANVVDPATRAQLGKIHGAEVVVLGSYQRQGETVRASARFVDAETGEVLAAVKVDRASTALLLLQDAVATELLTAAATAHARMRR